MQGQLRDNWPTLIGADLLSDTELVDSSGGARDSDIVMLILDISTPHQDVGRRAGVLANLYPQLPSKLLGNRILIPRGQRNGH